MARDVRGWQKNGQKHANLREQKHFSSAWIGSTQLGPDPDRPESARKFSAHTQQLKLYNQTGTDLKEKPTNEAQMSFYF